MVSEASRSDEWGTPLKVFQALHEEFDFQVDLAASAENHLLPLYWDREDDALDPAALWAHHWGCHLPVERAWLNPPYSKAGGPIERWMKKAHIQARDNHMLIVCLIPGHTADGWYQHWVSPLECTDNGKVSVHPYGSRFAWRETVMYREIRILNGRLRFRGPKDDSARFPSHVAIYDGR